MIDYEDYFPRSEEDYLQFHWDVGALASRQLVFKHLVHQGGRVLEIGPGAYGALIDSFGPAWEAHAIDVSKNTLESAARYVQRPIIWHQGVLSDAQFPDDYFDTVVSTHVIEHIEDDDAFIQECYRILIPGGQIIILAPGRLSGTVTQWERENWGHYRSYNAQHVHRLMGALPDDAKLEVLRFDHQILGLFWNRFKFVLHALNYPFRWYILRDNKSLFRRRWYQLLAPYLTRWLSWVDGLFANREGILPDYIVFFCIGKPDNSAETTVET